MNAISSWCNVYDGDIVIEDCYPEVYEVFTRDGNRWLRQIGWQLPKGRAMPLPENCERVIDFDPQPFMDQPWYRLPNQKAEDYQETVS